MLLRRKDEGGEGVVDRPNLGQICSRQQQGYTMLWRGVGEGKGAGTRGHTDLERPAGTETTTRKDTSSRNPTRMRLRTELVRPSCV